LDYRPSFVGSSFAGSSFAGSSFEPRQQIALLGSGLTSDHQLLVTSDHLPSSDHQLLGTSDHLPSSDHQLLGTSDHLPSSDHPHYHLVTTGHQNLDYHHHSSDQEIIAAWAFAIKKNKQTLLHYFIRLPHTYAYYRIDFLRNLHWLQQQAVNYITPRNKSQTLKPWAN
jgi:hypothetical protein